VAAAQHDTTLSQTDAQQKRPAMSPEDKHARLILIVGITMSVCFAAIVLGFVIGLLFISQPLEQAPNDAAFIDLLSTVVVFLTGSLGGLLASNGMKKSKQTGATNESQ
jgi:ABC-type transport system involved in multi-copper enzyme maturation permease subunit